MRIPSEYSVVLPVQRKASGKEVKLVQEWLCLHNCSVKVDGEFGPATEAAVRRFQTKARIHPTGVIDEQTYTALIAPVMRACKPLATTAETYSQRVVSAARQHLKEHPREVGGQNCGPWVRLYTVGKQGKDWPWCAAFVTYLMEQASEGIKPNPMPLRGSVSCDKLVEQAREAELFVGEKERDDTLGPGTLFVVRNTKNANDWIHTGVVTVFHPEYMETIEGNTNDDGSREGYEVCKRIRGYAHMDFIKLKPKT